MCGSANEKWLKPIKISSSATYLSAHLHIRTSAHFFYLCLMRKLSMDELNRKSVDDFKISEKMPVIVVLDNIRSMHNVGSVFRTADAFLLKEFICVVTLRSRPIVISIKRHLVQPKRLTGSTSHQQLRRFSC